MKNTITIKKNCEFKTLFSKGSFYYGDFIHLYVKKNNLSYNKIGIAISGKQGKAVERNKIKRLIREAYKNLENELNEGNSILFVVNKKKANNEFSYKEIEKNMRRMFERANLLDR